MSEVPVNSSEHPAHNQEVPEMKPEVPETDKAVPPEGALTAHDPAPLSGWAALIEAIKAFVRWVRSHRTEALGTSGLMLALALVVIGGLFWTDQGRDLLQSANDWYRGFCLFTGLTASLLILEGLILLLVKKDNEEFDTELLVRVCLISALAMGFVTWLHNGFLVGVAVAVAGGFVGLIVPCIFAGFLRYSPVFAAIAIGLFAFAILLFNAISPNSIGDTIGSALTLNMIIVGWLFLIFALATIGYISGKSGRGTRFIIYGAASIWAAKTVVVLALIWFRGYPILDYVRTDSSKTAPQLQTLSEAYANWKAALPADDKKPTFVLVGAAGGGIRASFWTSLIMTRLADSVPNFKDKLFASSGVSGGSLGLGVSYGLLSAPEARCVKDSKKEPCVLVFHDGDFLSGVIGATIAGLPANTLLPVFPGRDTALEISWENRWNWAVGSKLAATDALSKPIGDLWNTKAHPLLLLNATTATTGDRAVSADVAIDWVKLRTQCKINLAQEINPRLSASIGASARFPFVSDWGWVRISHSDACKQLEAVADGGFYDNYGAATLIDLINGLKAIDTNFFEKVHLVVIQITSDPLRDMGCLFKTLDEDKKDPADNFCQPEFPQPTHWSEFIDRSARLLHLSDAEKPNAVRPSAGLKQFFSNVAYLLQNASFGGGGPGVVDVAMQARAATGIDVAQSLRKLSCVDLHGSYYHFGMTGAQDIPLGWALSQISQERLTKLISEAEPKGYRTKRFDRLISELTTNTPQSQC